MQATLDEYQVVLLRRLYDADHLNQSELHDFETLMADQAEHLADHWYGETFEDFEALGLLDVRVSGKTFRNHFGRLSSHGRWFVESMPST